MRLQNQVSTARDSNRIARTSADDSEKEGGMKEKAKVTRKAAHLDPMLKPVHIVPIYQKGRGMVDTVMPGIGLYRIQAARTGQYAGISDPEYGPTVTSTLAGVEITYPEWCRVTVKRQMASGHVAEFTASERWLENYATSGRDTIAPNAMWKRRAFAQLVREFPIGKQGIGFDRIELDQWADAWVESMAIEKAANQDNNQPRSGRQELINGAKRWP